MGAMKNRAMEAEAAADYEVRVLPKAWEIEERADKPPVLRGYAAVFNKTIELFRGYFERVAPGAFTRTLEEGADVRALVDHDPSKILGRSTADPPTLILAEDKKGLRVEIAPPDTQVGRDIVESVRRGDVDQMSFGFRVVKEEMEDKDGITTRTLTDVELYDVSAVTYPAYPQTSIAVRSFDEWRSKHPKASRPPPPPKEPDNEPDAIDYSDVEQQINKVRCRPGYEPATPAEDDTTEAE